MNIYISRQFFLFSKNTQISNFIKISLVGAQLFHADGRTDWRTVTKKLIVAFRNFANAPKKCYNQQWNTQPRPQNLACLMRLSLSKAVCYFVIQSRVSESLQNFIFVPDCT